MQYITWFNWLPVLNLGANAWFSSRCSVSPRHLVWWCRRVPSDSDVLTVAAIATHGSMIQTSRLDALISVKTCETIHCSLHGLHIISVHILKLYISCIHNKSGLLASHVIYMLHYRHIRTYPALLYIVRASILIQSVYISSTYAYVRSGLTHMSRS